MQMNKAVLSFNSVSLQVMLQGQPKQLLSDVNLNIMKGERVGIIGCNGAGKTVLLKVASQIYQPTSGEVRVNGDLLSLFNISSGGNKNWTGRQNAEIKLLMYGVKGSKLRDSIEEIRDFSGVGDYFDTPVKYYSAGMAARLSFAIITSVQSDILVLDEWISVGDAEFKEKAAKRFSQHVSSTGTVLFCTHSPDILRSWATRVIWVENGSIERSGTVQEVLPVFHESLKVKSND